MIKRLKTKFILLATAAVILLMAAVVTAMNVLNFSSVASEADGILDVLSRTAFRADPKPFDDPPRPLGDLPPGMSPEVPYESRYFTVTVAGGNLSADTSRTVSVDAESAAAYAESAMQNRADHGFADQFRYYKTENGGRTQILFLDCGRKLDAYFRFLRISVLIAAAGCLAVFVIFLFAAERIVRPIAQGYEKQKRFITDAGHEIRTPLTVIGANADLLLSDDKENECLLDIRHEVDHLRTLTDDLVSLSRLEEAGETFPHIDFPASELIAETAQSFRAVAAGQGKTITLALQAGRLLTGSPDAIRRLVSLLLDNALKYSPAGANIFLQFGLRKRSPVLTVTNPTAEKISRETLSRVFDRFYRSDESRGAVGGNGIGLSVAQAIMQAHGGRISADAPDENTFRITAVFPS